MKIKKIAALIIAISTLICMMVIPANAAEDKTHNHVEIIIENENVSEETKQKAIAFYTNGGEETDGATTYGVTCTLLGHKLETTNVVKVTHKARTTAPRCLQKTYNYSTCTRCDYETSTLVSSKYISCC